MTLGPYLPYGVPFADEVFPGMCFRLLEDHLPRAVLLLLFEV